MSAMRVFRRHPRPPSSVSGPPIPAEGLGADAAGNAISVMPGRDLKSVVAFSRTPEGAFGAQVIAPPGAHQVLTGISRPQRARHGRHRLELGRQQ